LSVSVFCAWIGLAYDGDWQLSLRAHTIYG
jgi:hypothetical protein